MKFSPLIALALIGAVEGAESRSNVRGAARRLKDDAVSEQSYAEAADAALAHIESELAEIQTEMADLEHSQPQHRGHSGEVVASAYTPSDAGEELEDPEDPHDGGAFLADSNDIIPPEVSSVYTASDAGQELEDPEDPHDGGFSPSDADPDHLMPEDYTPASNTGGEEEVVRDAPPPPPGYEPSSTGEEVWHSPADVGEEDVLEAPPPPGR